MNHSTIGNNVENNRKTFIFLGVLIIISIVTLFNFEFRTSIISGLIFGVLSYPLYKLFQKKLSTSISATLTVILISFTLIFFSNILAQQISKEIQNLVTNQDWLSNVKKFGISEEIIQYYSNYIKTRLDEYTKLVATSDNLNKLIIILQQFVGNLFSQIIYLVVFLIAWFNSLINGQRWIEIVFKILPFTQSEENLIRKDLSIGMRNVIYANLTSGLLNALGVLVIMLIFKLPTAFFITIVAFIIGFLPISPSEIAYLTPLLILGYTTQNWFLVLIVALICEAFILWQNYVLLPKIVLSGTKGNPLFLITGVIAGINFFGIMGFIIGPVIVIFCSTMIDILLERIEKIDLNKLDSEAN